MTERRTSFVRSRFAQSGGIALMVAFQVTPAIGVVRASAQTSDSASIDATATLKPAPPVLKLDGLSNLQFGTVQIPALKTTRCGYLVQADDLQVLFEDGVQTKAGNCSFLDTAQHAGTFQVTCQAGLRVAYSISSTSPLAADNIVFDAPNSLVNAEGSTSNNGAICQDDGKIDFAVGGVLYIDGSVQPITSETAVGRILLDVIYEEENGCQYCQ